MYMKSKKNMHAHVLVIEDDKNLSYFIKKILEQKNIRVEIANDGTSGLKKIQSQKYNLRKSQKLVKRQSHHTSKLNCF